MVDTIDKDALDDELRDRLYRAAFEEFVGPVDFDSVETLEIPPTMQYNAGVLHPRGSVFTLEDDSEKSSVKDRADLFDSPVLKTPADLPEDAPSPTAADDEDFEEPISLSNARQQSALSMTVAVKEGDSVSFDVNAAVYERTEVDGEDRFVRRPMRFHLEPDDVEIPRELGKRNGYQLIEGGLELWIVFRRHIGDADVLTIALCNAYESSSNRPELCFFQVSVKVNSLLGLVPPVWSDSGQSPLSEEEAEQRLIYRNVRNYAIGHGCATRWEKSDPVTWAETQVMPVAETHSMKPMHPTMKDLALPLEAFGNAGRWDETASLMREMCRRYGRWIDDVEEKSLSLPDEHSEAASRNIEACRTCLSRMEDGLSILEADANARRAFIMANEAMYEQFLHYSVVSRERESFDTPVGYVRGWRPFQLAFILMNIRPIVDETSEERDVVDLIWFPTGGGKTEAYLGLTAFILIHERLCGTTSDGVSVFMRYTLRLLTSQQFDRASSLICALESMRRKHPDVLGSRAFRIGLWVGKDASPNNREEADRAKASYVDRGEDKNPFPVRQCPWCGASMEEARRKSYRRVGSLKRIVFTCPNGKCEFSSDEGLPLDVVDDEIYCRPPSLLVGTIDKFAMLPYRSEALPLFGIKGGKRLRPPKLIIQDELHLISGPLGSMAGHYETLISSLCEREVGDVLVLPKTIASTATVSRAREQCNQLYACGEENVFQFPPSGIDYDDSFFAVEDREGRGRRYVGVFVPTLKEASTNIKLYSDLMWEPATWKDVPDEWKDRYWTTVGYYGTTRELGQAVTWMDGDIPERLYEHRKKAEASGDDTVRYVNVAEELTGRKDADEVKAGLDSLTISYPDKRAVDLCFATNMISVGLDIGRLGLMVVAGQPKSTAEYIQATSRVGRGEAKGIVFVVYSTTKPRDRSHYENFAMFHESFYQNVEPSSVTAFCRQVRDRALFGTLAGIYLSLTDGVVQNPYSYPDGEAFDYAADTVLERIRMVDPEEYMDAKKDIEDKRRKWESSDYGRWCELKPEGFDPVTPLIHPYGADVSDAWSGGTFDVPTSMRSVDSECKVRIVGSYSGYEANGGRRNNA